MLDGEALILIAHSDWRTLMALYTLLDGEGHFAAPCFNRGDLLHYCAKYRPELVLTSDRLSGDEGADLVDDIRQRSPQARILLLPDGLRRRPGSAGFEPGQRRDILRAAGAQAVLPPPTSRNGR